MILRLLNWASQIYLDLAWWHIDTDTVSINLPLASNRGGGIFYESAADLDPPFDRPTQRFNSQRALGQIWTFFCQLCYLHVILDSRKGVSWAEPGSAVDCHRLCRKSIQHRFQIHSTPPHCLGRRLLWANLKRTDLKTNNTKLRWWGLWVLQQDIWNYVCQSNPFLLLWFLKKI